MSRSLPAQFSTQPTLVSALCPKAGCWKGTGFEDAQSPLLPPELFHQGHFPPGLSASAAPPTRAFPSDPAPGYASRFKGSSPRFLALGLSTSGAPPTKVPRIRALHQGFFPPELPASRALPRGSSHQGFPPQELFPPRFLASGLCPSGTSIFLMLAARGSRPQSQRPGLLSHSDTGAARSMPPCLSCRRSPALGYGRESWSEGSRTPPDHHPKNPKYDLGATTHPSALPKAQAG